MRQSIAAAALIRRPGPAGTLWLARWSRTWERYHLVGGHREEGESFRECLAREISEELALEEGDDYVMAPQPAAHLEFVAWSEGAKEETAYTTELFDVQLRTDAARRRVDENPLTRWLTEDEIRQGRCADGRPVSPTMLEILGQYGVSLGEGD